MTEANEADVDTVEYQKQAYVAVGLIMVITFITVFFPLLVTSSLFGMNQNLYNMPTPLPCQDACRLVMMGKSGVSSFIQGI